MCRSVPTRRGSIETLKISLKNTRALVEGRSRGPSTFRRAWQIRYSRTPSVVKSSKFRDIPGDWRTDRKEIASIGSGDDIVVALRPNPTSAGPGWLGTATRSGAGTRADCIRMLTRRSSRENHSLRCPRGLLRSPQPPEDTERPVRRPVIRRFLPLKEPIPRHGSDIALGAGLGWLGTAKQRGADPGSRLSTRPTLLHNGWNTQTKRTTPSRNGRTTHPDRNRALAPKRASPQPPIAPNDRRQDDGLNMTSVSLIPPWPTDRVAGDCDAQRSRPRDQ